MTNHAVRVLTTTIKVPISTAYEFAHKPGNFPQWAAGLSEWLHKTDCGWIAATPAGEATVRFSERNEYGVLDHWVLMKGKPEIYIPLRMVAHGEGTAVELMLFRQQDMTDADFDRDAGLVEKDLARLKALLEQKD